MRHFSPFSFHSSYLFIYLLKITEQVEFNAAYPVSCSNSKYCSLKSQANNNNGSSEAAEP